LTGALEDTQIIMKGLSTFVLATSIFSTYSDALYLQRRTDGPPRVVGFPVQRKAVPDPLLRDRLRRRASTVQASLENEVCIINSN
jgi:hypothetical protein